MAESVGQVALDIVMGKNTVTGVVKDAMSECGRIIGDSSASMSSKVTAIGTASTKVGAAMMPATTAVTGLGTVSVKTAAEFEASMAQVAATMGMTSQEISAGSEDYNKLEAAAREMGSKTKYSASEAAEALNYLALAGYDVDKSISTLPTVLNLACAGGIDLAYASDMVTDAMSALGDSAGTADNFVDKMAKTSQKSNTSIAQLGEAILSVGGTAKNLAGGTTELNTCLGILADNGIKGSEGGNALRNMILALAAPTDTAAGLMDELGLSVFDANGNMRPMNDIFTDLNGILSTMTQGEQIDVLNTIFNKVDLKSANAMLANCGGRFDELSGYLEDCDGSASKMADTMNNNLNGQLTSLKSALSEAAISMGQAMLPTIKEAVGIIQDLTAKFNSLDASTKDKIIKIALAVAAAGPLLIVTGKITKGIGSIIGVCSKLGTSIGHFVGLGNAAGKAAAPVSSAGSSVGKLSQNALGLLAAGAGILLASAGLALLAYSAIQLAQAGPQACVAMVALVAALALMAVGAAALAPALTTGAVGLIAFGAGMALVGAGVFLVCAGMALLASQIPTISEYGAQAAINILALSAAVSLLALSNVLYAGTLLLVTVAMLAGTVAILAHTVVLIALTVAVVAFTVAAIALTVAVLALTVAVIALDVALAPIIALVNSLTGEMNSGFTSMQSVVGSCVGGISSSIKEGLGSAFSFIKGIPKQAIGWGKDMIQGLINGIKSMVGKVGDAVASVGDKIKSFLHFSVPDEGPLTDYETWMPDFMQGLAGGIESNTPLIENAVGNVADSMTLGVKAPALKNTSATNVSGNNSTSASDNSILSQILEILRTIKDKSSDVNIPIYLDGRIIDEYLVNSNNRKILRSGGAV